MTENKKPAALITGVAGFIGYHLAKYFLTCNYQVIGVDNFLTGSKINTEELLNEYPSLFSFYTADISSPWSFIKELKIENLCYVFHLASPASVGNYRKYSLETLAANSVGLSHALMMADVFRARLIFSSTSEIYGDPAIHPQPENYWGHVNSFGPRACYDEAKRFGEALIYAHNNKFKTKHGLVRIFNTYGPRMNLDDGRVIISFIQQALKNQEITIYGNGQQTRSFCYVDDLISGLVKYAESELITPMNLGNDKEISILDLALLIKRTLNSSSEICHQNLPEDDPKKRCPDLTLAYKHLDYAPKTSLEQGILKMAEWVKDQLID